MTTRLRYARRWSARRRGAGLALAALALLACSDSTGPGDPLDGRWLAVGLPGGAPNGATIELTLDQQGDDVLGSGSMAYPPGFASPVTVQGAVSGTVVLLTIASPALAAPMTLQALLDDDGRSFSGPLSYAQASQSRTFVRDR